MTVVRTDYSMESMSEILKGADALHLNSAMVPDEAKSKRRLLMQHSKRKSSTSSTHRPCLVIQRPWCSSLDFLIQDGRVPSQVCQSSKHRLRIPLNTSCPLQGKYSSRILLPTHRRGDWIKTDAPFHASSLRDAARVTCKLFAEPWKLKNGAYQDAATEVITVDKTAAALCAARNGEPVEAVRGPWIFVTFGKFSLVGYRTPL